MTFLNPLLLLGLAAAAIPLIIHLFNFRKPKRVEFSSLAFLKQLQQSTMQRVRVKQWLLLLLRTLALACLAMAFARPTLTGNMAGALGGRANASVAVVVDNSRSMLLRGSQGAYLDQAQTVAQALVEQAEQGDEFLLVTTGEGPRRPLYQNRAPMQDAVADVRAQQGAGSLTNAIATAAERLSADGTHLGKDLYILTDAQASTLSDSLAVPVADDIRMRLIPIGDRTYANVAVTEVRVTSRIIEAGQPVRVEATLVNYGTEPVEDYVASVFLEGERVAQGTADLPPNLPTRVPMTVTPQQRGWLAGSVVIEEDAFEDDNERFFTLYVPEQRPVLVVRGDGQSTQYLNLALSPQMARGEAAFAPEVIAESGLAAAGLNDYAVVALVGVRTLSSGEVSTLARYVDGGGGLLFFPAAGGQADDYNALFSALGAGRFSGFSGAIGQTNVVGSFDQADLDHPVFDGVLDQATQTRGTLESPDVFFAMNYTAGAGREQSLIRLSNDFPFLQEVRHGGGVAFLMAVAPDLDWSDLPVRGLFVPLVYRSFFYLSANGTDDESALRVGQPGELRLPSTSATGLALISPSGVEYTPEQRTLFGATLLQTDATLQEAGIYTVQAGDQVLRRVAFNLDNRESDLRTLAPDAAAEQLSAALDHEVQVLDVGDGDVEQLMTALTQERSGIEIWNVFLMLALLFLVAEMVVAKAWRPESVPA
ncbi:MAG: BatA and WFA domain-containing protein [Bacteroidota bacterium]